MELARSSRSGFLCPRASVTWARCVAGRLAFPAPSLTFSCHQVGLRGLPLRAPLKPIGLIVSLASCSSALLQSNLSALGVPLLSWDSSTSASSPFDTPDVHSRGPGGSLRTRSATCPSCSAFAVSHRLDGFLHPGAAGLLHPAAGHEVRRVSVARRQHHPEAALIELASSPRRSHTLRRIPLVSSRTASPRPLPSCRYRSLRTPLRLGSRLGALPTLVGSVHLPHQVTLARGTSRSAGAARSVDLLLPAGADRSRSGLASSCRSRVWPGHASASAHRGALGLGLSSPSPPERLGLALAVGFIRRLHPVRDRGLGWLAPSRALAGAGSRTVDCTQSRDVVGSVGACSPRLGLRWHRSTRRPAPSRSPAASAGPVSRPESLDREPLCEAPRCRVALCLLLLAPALRCAPSTTRRWLAAWSPETPTCRGGHSRARYPGHGRSRETDQVRPRLLLRP